MPEVSRFYGIVTLSTRVLGMVTEWASLHQAELLASWEKAICQQPPGKIAPLP